MRTSSTSFSRNGVASSLRKYSASSTDGRSVSWSMYTRSGSKPWNRRALLPFLPATNRRTWKCGHFDTSTPLAPISAMSERRLSRYGPDDCTRCWADFSFAVATISMVRVIFFVEATLLIRLRMTFGCSGMLSWPRLVRNLGRLPLVGLEGIDLFLELGGGVVVQRLGLGD